MANFTEADRIRKANEGLYNPGATGIKETYSGIDRGANPHWSGWPIIDALKPLSVKQMNSALALNKPLQQAIIDFYAANYWNPIKLSEILDQQVAENAYDCSVNQGVGIAGKFMQMAANNVIQHAGTKNTLLIIDGQVGRKTIDTVNALDAELVFNEINALRQDRYITTANNNPDKKQWLKVWLKRLVPYSHSRKI